MLQIKGSDDALKRFNEMKLRHKEAWLIFHIQGGKIEVECAKLKADIGKEYLAEFCKAVKASGQPRFAVVDWNTKLLFSSWVPDTAKASNKMKYASVKEAFAQELVGVQIKVQATDDGELNPDVILEKTKSKV